MWSDHIMLLVFGFFAVWGWLLTRSVRNLAAAISAQQRMLESHQQSLDFTDDWRAEMFAALQEAKRD